MIAINDTHGLEQHELLKLESGSFLSMTFQALSQDLLHVSMQLESLEEKLQSSSSVRQTGGITIEELEKERVMLKKRRDTLDAQLKDNRVLTVEVRKRGNFVCVYEIQDVCLSLISMHLSSFVHFVYVIM